MMEKKNILIVSKGFYFGGNSVNTQKGETLSGKYIGEFTHMVVDKRHLSDSDGSFGILPCYINKKIAERFSLVSSIYYFLNILVKVFFRHFFIRKYDCVISRNPLLDGLLASLFCKLCGVPLIVEFNGNFTAEENWDKDAYGMMHSFKKKLLFIIIPLVCRASRKIRLLYPGQADCFLREADKSKCVVMHEFVPVAKNLDLLVENKKKIISCLGGPWHIKGMDLLIRAFNRISKNFPDYELRIHTWSMKDDEFRLVSLVESEKITIGRPLPYEEAQSLLAKSSLVVMPSRTEAMGRVLLEAMSYQTPVIGARVDGIPTYIEHGKNGLLFDKEDVDGLEVCIIDLLADTARRLEMGAAGRQMVQENWTEEKYLLKYSQIIERAINEN